MAARTKRRSRRPAGDGRQADVEPANPLISPQERALFRRTLAASEKSGIAAADDASHQSALKTPATVTDAALFAGAVQGVMPMSIDRARPAGRRPPPLPLSGERLQHASEHSRSVLRDGAMYGAIEGEVAERLWFARDGLQDRVLRKLRRGHLDAEAELDLHGLVVAEAHDAVDDLIQEATEREVRCVRIIHGKGNSSQSQQPVLKGNVDRWLRSRDEVLAFSSAPPQQGGTGAVLVLLRRR